MNTLFRVILIAACLCVGRVAAVDYRHLTQTTQEHKIQIDHDLDKDLITARLMRFRIGDEKEQYHSLDLAAVYSSQFRAKPADTKVSVELFSVVKARKLNSDLYVVFDVDGREVHFGSNRSAIRNPVSGRPWIGERIMFSIPTEEFQKLSTAKKLAIKMGPVRFDLDEDALTALKVFGETIERVGF